MINVISIRVIAVARMLRRKCTTIWWWRRTHQILEGVWMIEEGGEAPGLRRLGYRKNALLTQ